MVVSYPGEDHGRRSTDVALDEKYLAFGAETEQPAPREVIFADGTGQAHARRWTNRQNALSAVQTTTSSALIVAEALHSTAAAGVPAALDAIAGELDALWSSWPPVTALTPDPPRYSFGS